MAAPRLLPPVQDLKKMVAKGMTHQQIAEHLKQSEGIKVSRSAISAALSRAGLTERDGHRFKDEIPWRVKTLHLTQYPARMLRLLGRHNQGMILTSEEANRLDAWLASLDEHNAVVAYCPEGPGFIYVEADEKHDGADGIPIRRRTITKRELA